MTSNALEVKWIKLKNGLPKSQVPVLIYYRNTLGMNRLVLAIYVRQFELEVTDPDANDDWGDLHPDTEERYCPEGWYHYSDEEEVYMHIHEAVLYWMMLPAAPEESQPVPMKRFRTTLDGVREVIE
jgi:hypothetical protein